MRGIYKNLHPFTKIGLIALLALFGLFLFMILSAILAIPIFGIDAFRQIASSTMQFDQSNIGVLKYFQLAQSVGLFIFPSLVLALVFGNSIFSYLRMNTMPGLKSIFLAACIVFVASPFINYTGEINAAMTLPDWLGGIENWMKSTEESAAELTKMFVNVTSIEGLLFNIFLIAIIPAIGEELLFRGVIQRVLTEWTKNKHLAIWISAIVFSALHMQFYGFIPRALLGALFGYLFVWSGNLWLPIVAHFVNNAAAVIFYYFFFNGYSSIDPEKIGTDGIGGTALVIFSLILVILLSALLIKQQRKLALPKPNNLL